jgi:hypothetical protein
MAASLQLSPAADATIFFTAETRAETFYLEIIFSLVWNLREDLQDVFTKLHNLQIYRVRPFEWNNGVCQKTLLRSIITRKGLPWVYMQNVIEGKESKLAEREREDVRSRVYEKEGRGNQSHLCHVDQESQGKCSHCRCRMHFSHFYAANFANVNGSLLLPHSYYFLAVSFLSKLCQ